MPWIMRPAIRNIAVPDGESAIRSEPRILRARPILVSLTRPNWSARPPATTINIPENSAVMLTAMLLSLLVICRSSRMVGATFKVVWAKSQKVTTARTIPRINRLLPS